LSAHKYHFQVAEDVDRIAVMVRIAGKGWEGRKIIPEDQPIICRNDASQTIEEIYVILSNHPVNEKAASDGSFSKIVDVIDDRVSPQVTLRRTRRSPSRPGLSQVDGESHRAEDKRQIDKEEEPLFTGDDRRKCRDNDPERAIDQLALARAHESRTQQADDYPGYERKHFVHRALRFTCDSNTRKVYGGLALVSQEYPD
jgi:hypothetical protein